MIDLGKVEKLMSLMAQYGVDVVQAETGPEKIALAKNAGALTALTSLSGAVHSSEAQAAARGVAAAAAAPSLSASASSNGAQASAPVAAAPAAQTGAAAPKAIPEGTTVSSPFVGTFYRSPSPDSPSFVEIGTRVKKGQALCIVEAMKLMNEIESEIDGEVVGILVENAKPVEFGTPLFVIRP
ncbi:MAG: acetyl-CoA carboxylase biotin carboxyl carrier protein [Betaproteobacteria bacterium]|nr:acetyl-CoA carboxylase biotin carboxyl carrier protein [Betaproteobacteria bacterium]